MKKNFILLMLVFFLITFLPAQQVFAQDSAWGEVVDSNGNIMYDQMSDQGVVTQPASWMPSITLPVVGTVSVPAEYHSYVTESGNTVLMPTASTLFFMAANPQESGYQAAASTMGTSGPGVGVDAPTGIAGIGAVFGALLGNAGGSEMMTTINQAGFNGPSAAQDFFQSVVSGQTDIWSLNPAGLGNFLSSLYTPISTDHNLYTYMLLYTPGQCGSTPAGCSAAQLALTATVVPTAPPPTAVATPPPPTICPGSSVKPGAISASASEVAPPYPLVVGQDPDKRGVDVNFSASVAPTIYTYYTPVPIYGEEETKCAKKPCGTKQVITGYTCQMHTISYPECIASASASISLSKDSRDWILNELSIRYPEAYLHHPNFSFSGGGCIFSASQDHVQVADPGNWNVNLSGSTSGTPVSGARSFSRTSVFSAWLKEVVIIK